MALWERCWLFVNVISILISPYLHALFILHSACLEEAQFLHCYIIQIKENVRTKRKINCLAIIKHGALGTAHNLTMGRVKSPKKWADFGANSAVDVDIALKHQMDHINQPMQEFQYLHTWNIWHKMLSQYTLFWSITNRHGFFCYNFLHL